MTDHQILMNLLTHMGNLMINTSRKHMPGEDYPAKEYEHGQYVTAREVRKYILNHTEDTRPLEQQEEEQDDMEDTKTNWYANANGCAVYAGPADGRAIIL